MSRPGRLAISASSSLEGPAGHQRPAATMTPAAPGLQQVDRQQHHERHHQHDEAERRGAGVVELLQLDDDQQRRDLGLHRQVAGDEDDRAVLADRARERHREAGRERRQHRRQDDAAEDREAAGAERFGRVFQITLHFEQAPAAPSARRTAGRSTSAPRRRRSRCTRP